MKRLVLLSCGNCNRKANKDDNTELHFKPGLEYVKGRVSSEVDKDSYGEIHAKK